MNQEMKLLILFAILFAQAALAGAPMEALTAFKKAAQSKDFDATWKHAAKFEGLPDDATDYFKGKVQRFIDLTSNNWDFEILEEKVEGDSAVVVINESKKAGRKAFDLDSSLPDQAGRRVEGFPRCDRLEYRRASCNGQGGLVQETRSLVQGA